MQEPQLSRRMVLKGLGAGTLGLPGCISGQTSTQSPTEGTGYFIPGGDRYWGASGPTTWLSPATAHANQDAIATFDEFDYRGHRLNVWGLDLGVENLELLIVSPNEALEVYEGAFTAHDAMKIARESFVFSEEYEYRGFQILAENWSGFITCLAFQDGRVIKINDTIEVLDPRAATEAVIDTVTGHHSPHLPTQPYFRAIISELDTQLFWQYRPVESLPRLSGLWAEGQSIRITEQDEILERHVYGFTSRQDLEQATLDEEIESTFDYRMRPPVITQQDNLLILEASAPITELDSGEP